MLSFRSCYIQNGLSIYYIVYWSFELLLCQNLLDMVFDFLLYLIQGLFEDLLTAILHTSLGIIKLLLSNIYFFNHFFQLVLV